jgi:hypothetical protein
MKGRKKRLRNEREKGWEYKNGRKGRRTINMRNKLLKKTINFDMVILKMFSKKLYFPKKHNFIDVF